MDDFLGQEQCDDHWPSELIAEDESEWMYDEDSEGFGPIKDADDGQPDELTEWLDYDPDC